MPNGYECEFVDLLPDRLTCKVCLFPSRNPLLSLCCGHTFCKGCSDATWDATGACPMCRDKKFLVVHNKQADREIRSLHVMCTNKERGCKWQGELNDINNHLGNSGGCQFEDVKCYNECGKMLQRQYLTIHVETECPRRKVDCQYCHITGEHQFIEGGHKERCPKLPLPCPNKCEVGSICREEMENHRKVCLLEIIKCSHNCGKTLEQRYLTSHIETECPCRTVECQYCRITGEYQFVQGLRHRKICPKLPLPCPNKCEAGSILREGMEAHRKECPLEMVQCEYHNVGCEERMMRKELEKHMKEKMEQHLGLTKDHLASTKDDATQAKKQLRQMKGKMELLQKGVIEATDDLVECIATQPSIPTVPVIVRMAGFSQLKEHNEIWTSPSFSSQIDGTSFTMCLKVYANGNGDGIGKYMSVELHVISGGSEVGIFPKTEFDVRLLSQTDHTDGHVVSVRGNVLFFLMRGLSSFEDDYTKLASCSCFLSHRHLQANSQFLKDNCLYFKVSYHQEGT